jgi:transcriptional enhancer factor
MEVHLPNVNISDVPGNQVCQQSRVLQERSGNRGHGYAEHTTYSKRSSSSPENVYRRLGSSYFAGSIGQPVSWDKSEEQVEYEFQKVWSLLQCCVKYQEYRNKKPPTTKEPGKDKEDKEYRWPDNLERAFFRGSYAPGKSGRSLGGESSHACQP